jgi:hypothetical protein
MLAHLKALNPITTARDRPRVAVGQVLYILIWLGLLGVIIWYIVKQSQEYDESLDNPYTALTLKRKDEIPFPVITVCTYYAQDKAFKVSYFPTEDNEGKVGIPKFRYFVVPFLGDGFKCVAINENLRVAKGVGFSYRLGILQIDNPTQAYTFFMDETPQKRSNKELAILGDQNTQFIPTNAQTYFTLQKIRTKTLDGDQATFFNYTTSMVIPYTNRQDVPNFATQGTTEFAFIYENLFEYLEEERAVTNVLDLIGNIFGFIGLLLMMFAWVHLLIMGPFIAGVGFRSVWSPPKGADKYEGA